MKFPKRTMCFVPAWVKREIKKLVELADSGTSLAVRPVMNLVELGYVYVEFQEWRVIASSNQGAFVFKESPDVLFIWEFYGENKKVILAGWKEFH